MRYITVVVGGGLEEEVAAGRLMANRMGNLGKLFSLPAR